MGQPQFSKKLADLCLCIYWPNQNEREKKRGMVQLPIDEVRAAAASDETWWCARRGGAQAEHE
jgi:hypothetical protein